MDSAFEPPYTDLQARSKHVRLPRCNYAMAVIELGRDGGTKGSGQR